MTQAAAAPVAADPADSADGQIVQIVSEMTGYPADLLDLDLDLEADLGIDTVKQAEVFAAVRERFGIPRDENLRLRDFPTLAHVIGFARDRAPATAESTASAEATATGAATAPPNRRQRRARWPTRLRPAPRPRSPATPPRPTGCRAGCRFPC